MRLEAFDNVNQLDLVILCHENVEDMMDFNLYRKKVFEKLPLLCFLVPILRQT